MVQCLIYYLFAISQWRSLCRHQQGDARVRQRLPEDILPGFQARFNHVTIRTCMCINLVQFGEIAISIGCLPASACRHVEIGEGEARVRVGLFGEKEVSGNGVRCLACHKVFKRYTPAKLRFHQLRDPAGRQALCPASSEYIREKLLREAEQDGSSSSRRRGAAIRPPTPTLEAGQGPSGTATGTEATAIPPPPPPPALDVGQGVAATTRAEAEEIPPPPHAEQHEGRTEEGPAAAGGGSSVTN